MGKHVRFNGWESKYVQSLQQIHEFKTSSMKISRQLSINTTCDSILTFKCLFGALYENGATEELWKTFLSQKGTNNWKSAGWHSKRHQNTQWNWWHLPGSAPIVFSLALWQLYHHSHLRSGNQLAVTREAGRPGKSSKVHFQRTVYVTCTLSPCEAPPGQLWSNTELSFCRKFEP